MFVILFCNSSVNQLKISHWRELNTNFSWIKIIFIVILFEVFSPCFIFDKMKNTFGNMCKIIGFARRVAKKSRKWSNHWWHSRLWRFNFLTVWVCPSTISVYAWNICKYVCRYIRGFSVIYDSSRDICYVTGWNSISMKDSMK